MFESLSDKLHAVFKKLRGQSTLTESNITDAMSEIRRALLEADVNLAVADAFIESVRSECIGREVIQSVTPGQQVVKIVNDQLIELLGGGVSELDLNRKPTVIMLVGLHGSGKTTTAGKLARHLNRERGKKVMLVAGDVYRPAAIDQLEYVGREIGVPVWAERTSVNVPAIATDAVASARAEGYDVVIIDTAGRLQIDESMVQELVRIRQAVQADEVLLVADSALGQEAVSVAEHFHQALTLSGFILTKLDGDARGGAALSIRKVTGCPVKFVGSGEKLDALEVFYPERMASRILGMGDVVSLVEKAAQTIDEEEARALQEKIRKAQFDYNDFLGQLRQLSRFGGMESVLKFLPGGRQIADAMSGVDPKHFARMEAIILSMTPAERANPDLIDFSRRNRIARGSGVPVEQVSALAKQFDTMRKMMKSNGLIGRMMARGGLPGESAGPTSLGSWLSAPAPLSKKEQEKKKKKAKQQKKDRAKQRRHKR